MPDKETTEEEVNDDTAVSSSDVTATAIVLTVSPAILRIMQLFVLSLLTLGLCILVAAL